MYTCDSIRRRRSLSSSTVLSALAASVALNGAGCPNSGAVLSEVIAAGTATRPGATAPTDSANPAIGETPAPTPTPTPTAPAPITLSCGDPAAAEALSAFLVGPLAVEDGGPLQITSTSTSTSTADPGVRTVTWTGTDPNGGVFQIESSVTIIGDTTAPTLSLKGDANITLGCGMEFTDPGVVVQEDCDLLIQPQVQGTVDPQTPGRYTLTYTAADASANSATPLTRTVTVAAPSQPDITVNPPITLWPPNHRLVTFTLAELVTIDGGCGERLDPNAVGAILSIYSDEPGDADIVIRDAHTFSVVAERSGQGNGRVYGVRFEISQGSSTAIERIGYIHVPHDQSGRDVIDDGAESGHIVTR